MKPDRVHCFNFFTMSFKKEYLKPIEVVPAYSNIKRPVYLTSGCPKTRIVYTKYAVVLGHVRQHQDLKIFII